MSSMQLGGFQPWPQDDASKLAGLRRDIEELKRRQYWIQGQFNIKIVSDQEEGSAGDNQFIFEIPEDLDGWELVAVRAYVTTVGTTGTTVQLRNINAAVDMLTTSITIDTSEKSSRTAATAAVISATNQGVSDGDQVSIDVDAAGAGAKGLGVILNFFPVIT